MTRISSLFVATTLAVLPISAFAQPAAAPAKDAAPSSITSPGPAQTAPVAGKSASSTTAKMTPPAKDGIKTDVPVAKAEMHGMSTDKAHSAKTTVPAKTAEPGKS
jgi:hypothetical protein